jgi:flagellar biosynthesis chaperone FliJ
MSGRERTFAYRLERLLALRGAERDSLRAPVTAAAQEVERRERELETIAGGIRRIESGLRAVRGGERIAVDEQLRLQAYLKRERRLEQAKRDELDAALRTLTRAVGELQAKHRDARALESHKERSRRRHDDAQARVAIRAADDAWLARKKP